MNKFTEHLIAFLSGLICTAVFMWFVLSCVEVGSFGMVSDWNALEILF